MSNLRTKRVLVGTTILSLFVALVMPSIAFAGQNRGRGQEKRDERRSERIDNRDDRYDREDRDDRDHNNYRRDKRKRAKFINGHDARDGRWDGRGPQHNRWSNRYDRNRYGYRKAIRNRRRQIDSYDQLRSDRQFDYYDNRTSGSNFGTRDLLGGILGNILLGQ